MKKLVMLSVLSLVIFFGVASIQNTHATMDFGVGSQGFTAGIGAMAMNELVLQEVSEKGKFRVILGILTDSVRQTFLEATGKVQSQRAYESGKQPKNKAHAMFLDLKSDLKEMSDAISYVLKVPNRASSCDIEFTEL